MAPERLPLNQPPHTSPHGRTRTHMVGRGFTLLELVVVMALISILAAMAAPSVTPALRREALASSSNSVMQFMSSARMEAMSSRRCTRVRIIQATGPAIMVRERLNSFDCEDEAQNPPGTNTNSVPVIDSTKSLWFETGRLNVDPSNLTVSFSQLPGQAETTTNLTSAVSGDLRWRPTGRLFSSDTNVTNDDAAVKVLHPKLASPYNYATVIADGSGALCVKDVGVVVTVGAGVALTCY